MVPEARGRFNARVLMKELEADLTHDFDNTMNRVQEFLHLPSETLPQRLRKQAKRPVEDRLANYDELTETLRGTTYEQYL